MVPILSSPPFGDNVAPAPCQLPPQRAIPGRQGYTTGGSSCFVVAVVVTSLKTWVKQRALDWTWGQSGCFEGTNKTYKDLCRITWMSWENSTVEKSVESLDLRGTIWYPACYLVTTKMVTFGSSKLKMQINISPNQTYPNMLPGSIHDILERRSNNPSSPRNSAQDASLASAKGSKTVQSLRSSGFLSPHMAGTLMLNPQMGAI